MLPADAQLPLPEAGLNSSVVARVDEPFLPPATTSLPLERSVAVCCSRALDRAVSVLHDDEHFAIGEQRGGMLRSRGVEIAGGTPRAAGRRIELRRVQCRRSVQPSGD